MSNSNTTEDNPSSACSEDGKCDCLYRLQKMQCRIAAEEIWKDLWGRRGIKSVLYEIDPAIREEIISKHADIIFESAQTGGLF